MLTINELRQAIVNTPARSAWDRGRKEYALELLQELAENNGDNHEVYGSPADKKDLLNGASDWNQYSWGGCSFIYNSDIAERLCSPSELKRRKGGDLPPNSQEEWLDVQARALFQAANMILRLARSGAQHD